MPRPRISRLQRQILTRIADGWLLTSDGIATCWLDSEPECRVFGCPHPTEIVPMFTAERLILRNLVHPSGHLLADGWRAIGRTKPHVDAAECSQEGRTALRGRKTTPEPSGGFRASGADGGTVRPSVRWRGKSFCGECRTDREARRVRDRTRQTDTVSADVAGRDLDALVSLRVFATPTHADHESTLWEDDGCIVPSYSTSIEAAWLVVERLREIGLEVVIGSESDGWEVEIVTTEALHQQGYGGCYSAHAPIAEAICRAALGAIR